MKQPYFAEKFFPSSLVVQIHKKKLRMQNEKNGIYDEKIDLVYSLKKSTISEVISIFITTGAFSGVSELKLRSFDC